MMSNCLCNIILLSCAISHFLGTGQPIKFRMYFFGLQNNLQSAVHRFTIALFYSIKNNFFLFFSTSSDVFFQFWQPLWFISTMLAVSMLCPTGLVCLLCHSQRSMLAGLRLDKETDTSRAQQGACLGWKPIASLTGLKRLLSMCQTAVHSKSLPLIMMTSMP